MNCTIGRIVLAGIFLSLIGAGCKKDKKSIALPPKALLTVRLSSSYLGPGEVDSAFAIWKTGGSEQRIQMQVRHDSLIAEMNTFNEGSGELTLQIFSHKKYNNQYYGQWVGYKTLLIKKSQTLNYNGPVSFSDAAWFPRIELADAIGHKAIIALRPDDAYFFIKDPGHAFIKLIVERSYWKTIGGIQLAGSGVWQCSAGCTNVPNNEYFNMLPGRIGNNPWNHISIIVVFETDLNGGGWILSLEHDV